MAAWRHGGMEASRAARGAAVAVAAAAGRYRSSLTQRRRTTRLIVAATLRKLPSAITDAVFVPRPRARRRRRRIPSIVTPPYVS